MKVRFLVLAMAAVALLAFGLLLTGCDNSGSGNGGNGGGGEIASVAGTTWVSSLTRSQWAHVRAFDTGISVPEAYEYLVNRGYPASFPHERLVFFQAPQVVSIYVFDPPAGFWYLVNIGTWSQSGNDLAITNSYGYTGNVTITGNSFIVVNEYVALIHTFIKQ